MILELEKLITELLWKCSFNKSKLKLLSEKIKEVDNMNLFFQNILMRVEID